MAVVARKRFEFPGNKRFAFTIIDDTDDGTVANLTPVYRLLEELGMGATKTVWPMPCPEGGRATRNISIVSSHSSRSAH